MKIEKKEFPKEIASKLRKKIRQSIIIKYYDGAIISNESFNLTIIEPYKVLLRKGKKFVVLFITENSELSKNHYNFFANAILEESKHSLNGIIKLINDNLL